MEEAKKKKKNSIEIRRKTVSRWVDIHPQSSKGILTRNMIPNVALTLAGDMVNFIITLRKFFPAMGALMHP